MVPRARLAPAAPFVRMPAARSFTIEYTATVAAPPPGTHELRVWLPVPRTTGAQEIRGLAFSRPPRLTRGARFGNEFAYWEIKHPRGPLTLTMRFVCTRRELRTDLGRLARAGEGADRTIAFAAFHQPSRFALVDDRTRTLAGVITAHQSSTLARARAIYGYVLAHMRYDKSEPGWGQGSTAFACATGRGNCTDFHSLFDSLCQSAGIATEFDIGLLLPYDRDRREPLGGYHCWTYFRVPGRTWVPVDCSEASLHPALRQYFFGSQTDNRVMLSTGRDLVLVPAQAGPPLNYFVDPYAEADGRPVPATKTWTFRDVN